MLLALIFTLLNAGSVGVLISKLYTCRRCYRLRIIRHPLIKGEPAGQHQNDGDPEEKELFHIILNILTS